MFKYKIVNKRWIFWVDNVSAGSFYCANIVHMLQINPP